MAKDKGKKTAAKRADDNDNTVTRRAKPIGKTTDVIRLGSKKPMSKKWVRIILAIGVIFLFLFLYSFIEYNDNLRTITELSDAGDLDFFEHGEQTQQLYVQAIKLYIFQFLSVIPATAILIIILLNYPKQRDLSHFKELIMHSAIFGVFSLFAIAMGIGQRSLPPAKMLEALLPFAIVCVPVVVLYAIMHVYQRRHRRRVAEGIDYESQITAKEKEQNEREKASSDASKEKPKGKQD